MAVLVVYCFVGHEVALVVVLEEDLTLVPQVVVAVVVGGSVVCTFEFSFPVVLM